MVPPSGSRTEDGYETQWQTNVMGHWILVMRLLPVLQRVAQDSGGSDRARVVHTSSSGHWFAPRGSVDWDSLKVHEGTVGNGRNAWVLYGQSKLGNVVVANELDRRYGDTILSTSCNPGSESAVPPPKQHYINPTRRLEDRPPAPPQAVIIRPHNELGRTTRHLPGLPRRTDT